METFISELAKQGPIGMIAGLFIFLYLKQLGRTETVSDKRVEDLKEYNKAFTLIADKMAEAMNRLTTSFESTKAVIESLKDQVRRQP